MKCVDKLRSEIGENNIYLIIDETHDSMGRYGLNILVGCLNAERHSVYLLSTKFLEKTDSSSISALGVIWKEIQFDKVLLLVTSRKELFPNLLHISCQ